MIQTNTRLVIIEQTIVRVNISWQYGEADMLCYTSISMGDALILVCGKRRQQALGM